jgi:NAD(P)-dependent dehydrogenase (short-subunit alcohol dehydrogenase family)
MYRFSGKVVVVTGGAGGIGSATVRAFLSEGARVAILDKAPIEYTHTDTLPLVLDLSKEEHVRRGIEEIIQRFGKIDILFNNCGVGANLDQQLGRRVVMRGTRDVTDEDIEMVLATNLKSAIWLTKYCAPHMPQTEASCIISSSSIWAMGHKPGAVAYTASKAALSSVSKSWAYELTPIRAVTLILGAIDTSMFRFNPASAEETIRCTLAGRAGRPEEVAETVLFIASCHYLNAAEIHLDGGIKGW